MNSSTIDPTQAPPQLTQPPRSSFSCDRHPDEQFTGFCPECLCERLTTLDNNSNNNPSSSSRRPSTSSSSAAIAIKSLFSKPSAKPIKQASFFPELRRTKSFSASKNEALGFNTAAFEPQRKSCDVRARNTLWSLFSIDDDTKNCKPTCSQNQNPNDIADGFVGTPVKEEEEEDEPEDCGNVVDEIIEEQVTVEPEIVVEEEVNGGDVLKSMKDHIDLDSQAKKAKKEIAGSFWSAASVFSKKWHNWRKKQKLKKRDNGVNSGTLPVEKPISRRYNNNRDTQSEIADYGFGRRSCDTDPRFSLDAGRISFDDPRYSFDEPRASWDGYLIGRSFPRMPPMVSVIEDAPVVPHIPRFDNQIPVEEPRLSMTSINEDEEVPGGSIQTKEYYSDSSSRRRKSLDRSNSIRKTAAAVVAEMDEMKATALSSNAKVLPATGDQFVGARVLVGERDSNSLRDDCSETFELTGIRDINGSVIGNGERKESKKSRRWSWNLWGFIHRRVSGNKDEEEDYRYSRSNGVERSFSESWQDLRTNGDVRGGINRKVFRSNSSVSWRNSTGIGGGSFGGSVRKSGVEKKKRDDNIVLERNRSARYSPNHLDNGLLRFYLTPMRGSRRGFPGKSRPNGSHSIARSLLRLY